MTDLVNLMTALAKYCEDSDNVKVYDLNSEEGLKGFNKQLDELEDCDEDLLHLFGIHSNEWFDSMRKLGKSIYESNKDKKEEDEKEDRKVVDHTEDEKFERPSDKLTVDQKLQLHKITQEYVDTMIKPYNQGVLSQNQINDAYAGLFEFAAWIMNR